METTGISVQVASLTSWYFCTKIVSRARISEFAFSVCSLYQFAHVLLASMLCFIFQLLAYIIFPWDVLVTMGLWVIRHAINACD